MGYIPATWSFAGRIISRRLGWRGAHDLIHMASGVRSPVVSKIYARFLHLENNLHHQFVAHSVAVLRVAVGLVFLGFGILKYFPGVSPAQNITEATTHILFFGLIPGRVCMILATLESFIGAALMP